MKFREVRGIVVGLEASRDLAAAAEHGAPVEACGFLLGAFSHQEALASRSVPVRNADSRRRGFAIPDHELWRTERLARRLGLELVAVYHTHPGGDYRPSEADREGLLVSAVPWVIVCGAGIRMAAYAPRSANPIPLRIGVDTPGLPDIRIRI